MAKAGRRRNDPCWCPSGLKYKHCHLDWDQKGISPDAPTPDSEPVGRLAGYEILVVGERPHPDRWQRWDVPHGTIETRNPADVFEARVGAFSLDSILSLTAGLTRKYWKDRAKFDEEVRKARRRPGTVFLPFLLRRLVTQAISRRALPDTVTPIIGAGWLSRSEMVLMDVAGVSDRRLRGDLESGSLAMRTLQSQFHDQLDEETYLRELWLNLATVERCRAAGLDLDAAYKTKFGLSYSELAALSFGAWALISESDEGVVDREIWNRDRVVKIDAEVIDAFFKLCGLDYVQFQEDAADPRYSEPGFEPYAFSPLISSPLILRDSGTYIAPIARDLLERPTRGFPIDARRAVGDSPKDNGTLSGVSGSVYEDYVQDALAAISSAGDVYRADVLIGSAEMNCDFVCVEPGGITLVEAKSVRLNLLAEMTKRRDLLAAEMRERGLGHGLAQLQASADRIASAPALILKGRPMVGLLVVRGELVLVNSPEFRSILEEIAGEELEKAVSIPYLVVNDESFWRLIRLGAEPGSLYEFLAAVAADQRRRTEDLHNAIQRERGTLPDHPLASRHQAALDEVLNKYIGQPI